MGHLRVEPVQAPADIAPPLSRGIPDESPQFDSWSSRQLALASFFHIDCLENSARNLRTTLGMRENPC